MDSFRLFICCLFFFIPTFNAHAQNETPQQLLETVQSSLVEVHTVNYKTFNEKNGHTVVGTYQTQGSGIIIDPDGLIVTNSHIIANAPHIFVGLTDGTVLEARSVYSSNADFSFIKIDPPYPLRTIRWADSSSAKEGTPIIALTNIDPDHQQIQGGEITQLIPGVDSNEIELFELNLDLNHGDSGGPLLDNQGQLLGMIMGKRLSEDNKTYAIASNKIQQEYQQYRENPPSPNQ